MLQCGIEIDRRLLSDRATVQHRGKLVIMDITDQGKPRLTKVVRIISPRGTVCELFDVHIVWASDGRIAFTGDERIRTNNAEPLATSSPGCVRCRKSTKS